MKILVLTDLYPPYFQGGYELKCKLHVEELQSRGHEIIVLTSQWGIGREFIEGNVRRLLRFNSPNPESDPPSRESRYRLHRRYQQFKRAVASRINYGLTRSVVQAWKPEVAYIWNMEGVSASPVLAVHDRRVPVVFRLDDYWLAELRAVLCLEPNPLKRQYRAAIEGLRDFNCLDNHHMLIVSQWVKRRYVELGFASDRALVIPEGVPSSTILDEDHISGTSRCGDQVRMVHVGRIIPEKGTDIAVRAMGHLVRELGMANLHLDIIGTGPLQYLNKLRGMVASLGLEDHIHFLGWLEHRQVLERFATYNVVLIPSVWEEPLSGTIAEAMACGLPVIATNCGGSPEIISDCENGMLVRPGDPEELAHAMRKLAQDPYLLQKFRREGLNTVRNGYVHERLMDDIEKYLRMACGTSLHSSSRRK